VLLAEAHRNPGKASVRNIVTAQVHATLAVAAATAPGTARDDALAWDDAAGTKFSSEI
jgi:hypothetical protein